MTDNRTNLRSTFVVVGPEGACASRERVRSRARATHGTSPFLGAKGKNQSVFAKRYGRGTSAQVERAPREATAGDWTRLDAPPLYHGLPSGEVEDDVPLGSTTIIHDLESELCALEGRILHRVRDVTRGVEDPAAEASPSDEPLPEQSAVRADDATPPIARDAASRWDVFGRDRRFLERFEPVAEFLTKRYFRTVVTGIEHLPASGPCLLVANHSGALPIDGLVLKSALRAAHPERRHVRWLTEDFVQNLPFVGTLLQRLGAVRASRENALGLLQSGECVVAFPEGVKGYAKPIAQWYHVQRLGRGRIVGLCVEAGVPLLPCAIVGGEEATPSLRRLEAVERLLGTPYFPITPTFPWLGPLGLLPAPSRWYIDIGPPFLSGQDAARSDDPLYVANLTEQLRSALQQRVDRLVARRKSAWLG